MRLRSTPGRTAHGVWPLRRVGSRLRSRAALCTQGASPVGRVATAGSTLVVASLLMLIGPAGLVRAATPGVDGRIAYVGYAPVPGEPDAGYEAIFTANPDGSARKLVPHSGTPETTSSHPVWSPDSTRLAFVSEHSDPDTG